MSLNLNKAVIAGNVGNDPKINQTDSGKDVANFSIATNDRWKDKQTGEMKEHTEWHNIVVWGPLVSKVIEPYVKKGSPIYIEGQIKNRSYEKDGETKYVTEVVLQGPNSVLKLNGRSTSPSDEVSTSQTPQNGVEEDEIPF
jgi:single-strand DNA-binding protein